MGGSVWPNKSLYGCPAAPKVGGRAEEGSQKLQVIGFAKRVGNQRSGVKWQGEGAWGQRCPPEKCRSKQTPCLPFGRYSAYGIMRLCHPTL